MKIGVRSQCPHGLSAHRRYANLNWCQILYKRLADELELNFQPIIIHTEVRPEQNTLATRTQRTLNIDGALKFLKRGSHLFDQRLQISIWFWSLLITDSAPNAISINKTE